MQDLVDYIKGEINLTTINITSTDLPNNIIEVQFSQNPMMS